MDDALYPQQRALPSQLDIKIAERRPFELDRMPPCSAHPLDRVVRSLEHGAYKRSGCRSAALRLGRVTRIGRRDGGAVAVIRSSCSLVSHEVRFRSEMGKLCRYRDHADIVAVVGLNAVRCPGFLGDAAAAYRHSFMSDEPFRSSGSRLGQEAENAATPGSRGGLGRSWEGYWVVSSEVGHSLTVVDVERS